MRRMTLHNPRHNSVDQPDFSALAIHMRTASQMLAQLDATSGKRPRQEVAAIRSRIIASMQSLEEQSFEIDDGQGPTFEMIMAKAETAAAADGAGAGGAEAGDDATAVEPNLNANAGIDRMENDIKTGGLQRKGDRDDPSAAVFGEAWETKKERIRKSSPYGWMKNWDLVSVIVKTGSDLRQEAFACQLIRVCHKIWVDAGVPVWVKLMRILVTGESSGLIETIANGVSLHSIKRSLTLASIESGQNPRRRIATLKDHFVKAFGIPEGEAYRAGVDAFKRSLAAYSVISYVLQLKDRHNGNVLIDNEGHIIHIDFGFMLSNSPGSVGFEAAPFKLTYEYVDVLGGVGSQDFEEFKGLCKQAFQGGCSSFWCLFLLSFFVYAFPFSSVPFPCPPSLPPSFLKSRSGNANPLCDDSPPPLGRQHHRPGRHDGPRVQDAVLRRRRLPGHHGAAPTLSSAAERRRGRAVCRDGSDCQVGGQLLYEAVSFSFS
jgi:phosphatidylinositol 4-kinase